MEISSFSFCIVHEKFLLFKDNNLFETIIINRFNFEQIYRNTVVIRRHMLRVFTSWISDVISSGIYRWFVRFNVVGYHYTMRTLKRRRWLYLRMGYRYRFVIVMPKSLCILAKRRFFCLVGEKFKWLVEISNYIRNLRNLFPYKIKGIVYSLEKLFLKPGKRARLR